MYLGPFFFDTKEIFLMLTALLVGAAMIFNLPLLWFDPGTLLTLCVLILITKGLLPAIHNESFFNLALTTIFLSIFFPLWQVVLFYFISFMLFRVLKVI